MRTVFPDRKHVVLPVIHAETETQALRNAAIAHGAGCDGVFLINHSISADHLLKIAAKVRKTYANLWVGINCLGQHPREIFGMVDSTIGGIWVDNAMVDEQEGRQEAAEKVLAARDRSGWKGLYFGGVAFKYQKPVTDLERASRLAAKCMDVITTSGPGTGQAALPEKIARMKAAVGNHPLAIASGITPENVADYLSSADCFLVATGISRTFTEFDPNRVSALVERVRACKPPQERDHFQGPIRSICFVCDWNEGRSAHLELSVRCKLRLRGIPIQIRSAGLRQGGGINAQRRAFLQAQGIPLSEIQEHRSTVFNATHAASDLILVSELRMKRNLLTSWPQTESRVMTIRGFAKGLTSQTDLQTPEESHIEDAGGHTGAEKAVLYEELEDIAVLIVQQLSSG